MNMSKETRQIVCILTFLNILAFINRYITASTLSFIEQDLHLNDTQGGFIISSFVLIYSLSSPLFGIIGDRYPRKPLIFVSSFLWSAATFLSSFVHSWWSLLLLRGLMGLAESAFLNLAPSIIDERVSEQKKARAFGFFYLAIYVGAALGYILGGSLSFHGDWRNAYFWTGLISFPFGIISLKLKEKPSIQNFTHQIRQKTKLTWAEFWGIQKKLLQNIPFTATILGFTAWTIVVPAFSNWAPTFMYRELSIDLNEGSIYLGAATVISGVLGTLVGSYWSDHWSKSNFRAPLLVCAFSTIPAALCLTGLLLTNSPHLFWIYTTIALFFLSLSTGPVNVVIMGSVPFEYRTSAMALSIFVCHWLGDIHSPALVGFLSDHVGLKVALLFLPFILIFGTLLWIYGAYQMKGQTKEGAHSEAYAH